MIEFEKIEFKNFFNYGNELIEINLKNNDFACIVGPNGVGKSTAIIETINFALFGKSFRGLNKNQVINNINQKNCQVYLTFIKNTVCYKIERNLKPNHFKIFENEKQIESKSSDTELQKYLEEKILGFDEKVFKAICMFGSGLYVPFLELDLPSRRTVIENVFNLSIFSKMQIVVKNYIKKLSLNESEHKQKENILSAEINTMKSSLEMYQKDITKDIKGYEENIKKLENSIVEYSNYIEKKNNELKVYYEKRNKFEKRIENLENQITEGQKLLIDRGNKIQDYNSKNNIFNNNLKKLKGKAECPLCGSKAQNFEELIKEWEEKIQNNNIEKDKIQKEYDEINKVKDNVNEKINDLKNEDEKNTTIINNFEKEIGVNEIKKDNCTETIEDFKIRIENLKNRESIDENELTKKQNEFEKLNSKRKEILEEINYYNIIKKITSDQGLKNYILKKYLPVFNKRLNYYLQKFNLGFNLAFNENFQETIISKIKEGIPYKGLSQGQKSRINFAILFTFIYVSQYCNSSACNILFMDEVLDSCSLDDDGVNELLQLIKEIKDSENKLLYVISHREKTQDLFDKIIRIYWDGLFAKIKI